MFKSKKADFPPRPDPPSWEEMEQDLTNATNTDIIFTYASQISDAKENPKLARQSSSSTDLEAKKDTLKEEHLFSQAVDFVEKNDELLTNIKLLDEEKEHLKEISTKLKMTVEEVRKQALVAIDGY